MSTRPGNSGLTDAQVASILGLFNKGDSQRSISSQLGVNETVIKEILKKHKVTKRDKPLSTTLTSQQEELLAKYLIKQNNFNGNFRSLRSLVEKMASDRHFPCPFTFAWRRSFSKRYQNRLPPNIKKLLATRPKDETVEDTEEEVVDEEPAEEGIEWRIVQLQGDPLDNQTIVQEEVAMMPEIHLTEEERFELAEAVDKAMKAFDRAGIPDARARNLLRNMNVPGFGVPGIQKRRGPKRKKRNDSTGWRTQKRSSPEPIVKLPVKKTPLQLRVLEREFLKNPHLAGEPADALAKKLSLSMESVLAWFRNRRQKRTGKK